MAVTLAKQIGAEIYVTVGSRLKKQLIMTQFGIPEDHIFSSRSTTFAAGIKRMAAGKGVDVILNSLSGEQFRGTRACTGVGGRFIEIGKKDLLLNSKIDMAMFYKTMTYSSIDLAGVSQNSPEIFCQLFHHVLSLIQDGSLKTTRSITTYDISEIGTAFRQIQSGKHVGKTVLTIGPDSELNNLWVSSTNQSLQMLPPVPSEAKLASDCLYLIAGGLGGLGRVLYRWMADHGANNIIVISRSGPQGKDYQSLVQELQASGAKLVALTCDIGEKDQLKDALQSCSAMPPIREIIHAAMELNVSVQGCMSTES